MNGVADEQGGLYRHARKGTRLGKHDERRWEQKKKAKVKSVEATL